MSVRTPALVHAAWMHVQDRASVSPWLYLSTVRFRPDLRNARRGPRSANRATDIAIKGYPRGPRAVGRATEIVIEGYPRSANTFAVVAFWHAQGRREIEIAHHLHAAAQIKRAAHLGVPVMLLIREPSEAIISAVSTDPSISIRFAARSYIRFYSTVLPYLEKTVVAPFATVTSDIASIIRRVNERYATAFHDFVPSEDALDSVRRAVEQLSQLYSGVTGGDYDLGVALPSEERGRGKEARRTEYLDERNKSLRLSAEALYEQFMQYSRN
jgi:hypothetical protein